MTTRRESSRREGLERRACLLDHTSFDMTRLRARHFYRDDGVLTASPLNFLHTRSVETKAGRPAFLSRFRCSGDRSWGGTLWHKQRLGIYG